MKLSRVVLVVLALSMLLGAATCIYTVEQTEVGIVTRFGRPLESSRQPGPHLKLPWPIDRVHPVDARTLLFENEPSELLTLDKKNVLVDSFVVWRIADPIQYTRTVRTRIEAEARLLDLSASALGTAVGKTPMERFIAIGEGASGLSEVAREVVGALNRETRASLGVEVLDFQISGFNLPPQNRQSVIARMRAERSRIATRYRSEGEERALKIKAASDAECTRILAEAKSSAERVRGEAEARALEILGDAHAKNPELYRFLRTLSSYETILDEDTVVMIDGDSPLLEPLHHAR